MSTTPSAIVLAAGDGARMRSRIPKPLHPICGRAMVLHVLDALAGALAPAGGATAGSAVVVVVRAATDQVAKSVRDGAPPGIQVETAEQPEPNGTGEALAIGLTGLPAPGRTDESSVVVLAGDMPLLRSETIAALVKEHEAAGAAATLLTAQLDDPAGYGRVVRDRDGAIARVVEDADASPAERRLREVSTSVYCFRKALLAPALRRISPANAQGEYYLPDVLAVLHDAGHRVGSVMAGDPLEAAGVNDRAQLAAAEAAMRRRINSAWMSKGVAMVDPASTYVDADVLLSADVTIHPGSTLTGRTVVGPGAVIGPCTHLAETDVGPFAVVRHSHATLARIGEGATVGPFAVIEPGAVVPEGAVIAARGVVAGTEASP